MYYLSDEAPRRTFRTSQCHGNLHASVQTDFKNSYCTVFKMFKPQAYHIQRYSKVYWKSTSTTPRHQTSSPYLMVSHGSGSNHVSLCQPSIQVVGWKACIQQAAQRSYQGNVDVGHLQLGGLSWAQRQLPKSNERGRVPKTRNMIHDLLSMVQV